MKTIQELLESAEIKNVCFSEISKETTDFTHYEFLNNPFCTLIYTEEQIGGLAYYIKFNCEDRTQRVSLSNGIYKVETEDDFIYNVQPIKSNQIILNT